jgi:two-component system sensor histidine kinase BarA
MNDERPVVLIVDDEPLNLEVLADTLQADYRIKVATNGAAALTLAHLDPSPDLILLDVMMPDLDGYAVCAALKREPRTAAIPVIFITARTDPESETLALAGGAVDFIHKPINPPVVRARVRLHLELAQHRHRLEDLVQARTLELAQARDAADSANRAKDAFLANISHAFRTPLNAITGIAYLLHPAVVTGQGREFLTKIDQAARHLLDLVNDLLDLSSLEAGQIHIETRVFDLGAVLREFVQDSQALATTNGLTLSAEIAPDLPADLTGDPARLRQVLGQLLGNAVKFSDRGAVTLRAQPIETQGGRLWVRFEVQDQGIGITPEVKSGLFQLLNPGDSSLTRQYQGTGLGLALCRRLVALMGGEIGLVSTPGQGTTVWFRLPLGLGTTADNR